METYDVIVIGVIDAGVAGCMIARWLSRYDLRIQSSPAQSAAQSAFCPSRSACREPRFPS